MMELALWIVAAVLVGFGLLPVLATIRFRRYVRRELGRKWPEFAPKVSVILPCKGIDAGFEENIRSLLDQHYPDYEVIFVTATRDDPAYALLESLTREHPGVRTKLVVAGLADGRSEKINNQLEALRHVSAESEALVFVDSDMRARNDLLDRLVRPLQDPGIGATTGFRWYVPAKAGFGSYLQATWNGGGLPLLADPRVAYAWGGAMAVMRSTFQKAAVIERWQRALSDDLAFTNAIRSIGRRIHFIPECLTASHESRSFSETVEWTNRQTIISRVYIPRLWQAVFFMHAVLALGILMGVLALAVGLTSSSPVALPGLLMLSVILIECLNGVMLLRVVRRLVPEADLGPLDTLFFMVTVPAAMLLVLYNSLHSLMTNRIRWRGTVYTLLSPRSTLVSRP